MNNLIFESRLLTNWLDDASKYLRQFENRKIVVVSLIGKDSLDRSKGEELNDLLQYQAFPAWTDDEHRLSIEAFFSSSTDCVFFLVNGPSDSINLEAMFLNSEKTFFEQANQCDQIYYSLLHFVFLVSHIVCFVEPAPRLDMGMVRHLKNSNSIRIHSRGSIIKALDDLFGVEERSKAIDFWIEEGRLSTPRLLFGFHRNVIRVELGNQKKREIYEKLERSLEEQIMNVFRYFKITQNGKSASLGYIPSEYQYAHLFLPGVVTNNPLADLLDLTLGEKIDDVENKHVSSMSFSKFLKENIESVRRSLSEKSMLLTLAEFVKGAKVIHESIKQGNHSDIVMRKTEKFTEKLTSKHINDAISFYLSSVRERIVTKAEHAQAFAAAVSYLDSVFVESREEAMAKLRHGCKLHWEGGRQGCEQPSLTNHSCQMAVHPNVGDASVDEKKWELHNSGVTFISTCTCGRTQALRKDPFNLKEANYDFYFVNPLFTCCQGLERHNFAVFKDDESADKEEWSADEDWPRPGGDSNSIITRNTVLSRKSKILDGSAESLDSAEECSGESDVEKSVISEESSASDVESSDESEEGDTLSEYMRTENEKKNLSDTRLEQAIQFHKHTAKLDSRKVSYILGTPNSESLNILPLFPSWTLTCIGPSSIYSHSIGLRDQPNFKISGEYLLPVDIQLQVNPNHWEQDMQCLLAMEGTSQYARHRKQRRATDVEKVKLFVGFDYECPRGHRFFVNHDGEPLLLPRGNSARDAALKEAVVGLLSKDLPLRRQCTCRKLPLQVAQLTKIHIITPKAPVTVTLDPSVILPDVPGVFSTGEGPLQLTWARYYILQLPFVYSGASGNWIPPTTLQKVGVYKGNSIKVTYNRLDNR